MALGRPSYRSCFNSWNIAHAEFLFFNFLLNFFFVLFYFFVLGGWKGFFKKFELLPLSETPIGERGMVLVAELGKGLQRGGIYT